MKIGKIILLIAVLIFIVACGTGSGSVKSGSGKPADKLETGLDYFKSGEYTKAIAALEEESSLQAQKITADSKSKLLQSGFLYSSDKKEKIKATRRMTSLERSVAAKEELFNNCYLDELKDNPKLAGVVDLVYTVDKDGDVIQADVRNSTLGNALVGTCIIKTVKEIKFIKDEKYGKSRVRKSFVFFPE